MKKLIVSLLICCPVFLFSACGNASNKQLEQSTKSEVKHAQPSKNDLMIADEYNKIMMNYNELRPSETLKKAKEFLPQIKKIQDDRLRNQILMNAYFQLSMFQEAYDLNEALLKENPTAFKQQVKCKLMENLGKSSVEINECVKTLNEM